VVKTSNKTNDIRIHSNYFIVAILVSIVNIAFYDNKHISITLIIFESFFLLYLLIQKKHMEFISFYLIFLSLSLEFVAFLSENDSYHFYSFKNFTIFGFNLGLIFIVLLLVHMLITYNFKFKYNKVANKNLFKFFLIIVFLPIISIFTGLINIMINDNNIQNIPNYLLEFLGQGYPSFYIIFVVLTFLLAIRGVDRGNIYKLENALIAVLIASSISLMVAYFFGIYGRYSAVKILVASNVSWFIPFLLIVPIYYKNMFLKISSSIIGIIGTILLISYNANGKVIIFSIIVLVLYVHLYSHRNVAKTFLAIFIIIPSIILGAMYLYSNIFLSNILFQSKLNQVLGLLNIFDENWLQNMPSSPKFRVMEFLNILFEYLNKPYMLIMGKGFLGSVQDHLNGFGNYVKGTFSISEFNNNSFYSVHETLNELFLRNGILGIFVLVWAFKEFFRHLYKNVWVVIGFVWFITLYGYSLTIGIFGVLSITLGLLKIDLTYMEEIKVNEFKKNT
jgi:hypothetical protein